MRRVMSLWLPNWPIDRLRQHANQHALDRPFVLAASIGNRRVVTAANAAAEARGIAPGLSLADACALYPALAIAEADPAGDAAALARLAAWCGRYSPWTAPHGAAGIWLDITGCAHLRGGEEMLASDIVERLAEQSITCRAAIADTAGAAWAMARCGNAAIAVVPAGSAREVLTRLPIRGLRLDDIRVAELERLGLRRIGDLYAIPRAALAVRFGDVVAQRLDEALSEAPEPLSPLSPTPARWTSRRFAEPIGTPEDLGAAMRELLEALCRRLASDMLGARRLVLTLYRIDGTSEKAIIGTARPSRDVCHLLRLLEEKLATLNPGLGVEDMVLAAPMVEKLAAAQLGLGKISQSTKARGKAADPALLRLARGVLQAEGKQHDGTDEAELAALVDRLANRLGSAAIGCLKPHESHVPERAAHFAPVFTSIPAAAWNPQRLRPIRLLARPEPIEAIAPVPDDPPILFRWRRLGHRVRRADGPERIAGEWWRGAHDGAELRDYYHVEDEAGRRFWLYRAGLHRAETRPRWFLHGFFA